MQSMDGVQFARVLLRAFDAMITEVGGELARAGHASLTVGNELAMQAIEEGAVDAATLGRRLGVTRQAAAKTIAGLERLGYVTRTSHVQDARRKHLRITDHGHDAVAIGAAAFNEVHARWRQQIGAEAADATARALQTLAPELSSGEHPQTDVR